MAGKTSEHLLGSIKDKIQQISTNKNKLSWENIDKFSDKYGKLEIENLAPMLMHGIV